MNVSHRQAIARVAAPLAFLLLATLGVVAVRAALDSSPTTPPAATVATTTSETASTEAPATQTSATSRARYYRVQSGDTLESIATQIGTTVDELKALNPGIDPVALRIGQRIRVG
jgi:LysM repeat protein